MKISGTQFKEALDKLVEEYNFDPLQIIEIIKMWIKTAYRKDYLKGDKKIPIQVHFDSKGNIKIQREYEVVDKVEDPIKQISIKEAKKKIPDVKIWDKILIDITPENLEFSRIAVQAAAQTIRQNIKKIEKERFYEKFKDKQWQVVKAKVLRMIGDNVLLEIDGATVIMDPKWQIPKKTYNPWEEILVLIKKISTSGGTNLEVTQSDPEFVKAILEENIPELEEWLVKIEKIVRIPWVRTKVLVSTEDERIDPVGVFVWLKWERIYEILSLLDWEKIDFIEKTDDIKQLIKDSLKPAKVDKVELDGKIAKVYVPENQKAIAIWKNASNIKLASKLTGYKIELI